MKTMKHRILLHEFSFFALIFVLVIVWWPQPVMPMSAIADPYSKLPASSDKLADHAFPGESDFIMSASYWSQRQDDLKTRSQILFLKNDNFETLVSINIETGKITYGPHYHPDKAAKLFWKYMGKEARCGKERK